MQLAYTIFYVDNVRETIAFYERAFGLSQKFVDEGGDFGQMETGSTSLAFCSHALLHQLGKKPGLPNINNPCFEIAFTVPDVATALDRALKGGATLIQDIRVESWGQTVAYVADPNGFLIELCTPMTA